MNPWARRGPGRSRIRGVSSPARRGAISGRAYVGTTAGGTKLAGCPTVSQTPPDRKGGVMPDQMNRISDVATKLAEAVATQAPKVARKVAEKTVPVAKSMVSQAPKVARQAAEAVAKHGPSVARKVAQRAPEVAVKAGTS